MRIHLLIYDNSTGNFRLRFKIVNWFCCAYFCLNYFHEISFILACTSKYFLTHDYIILNSDVSQILDFSSLHISDILSLHVKLFLLV